jgi:hypothetical protein
VGMNSISNFFSKFLKLQQDSEEIKNKIINVLKSISGINLDKEKISFKEGIVSINCSPLERTQIYMNKEKILESLNLIGIKARDIR